MTLKQIITHPGGAHFDEFMACALLVAKHGVPISRREPLAEDLQDPETAVVDVGHHHQPELANFDHHQLPVDHPPCCALSLVLMDLGLYEDAREFCPWLEASEWIDTRGPIDTAKWLGVPQETMSVLRSPVDVALIRRFSSSHQHLPGEPLYQIMQWIGGDLIEFLGTTRARLDAVAKVVRTWAIQGPQGPFRVLFMPRADGEIDEPSSGLGRYADSVIQAELAAGGAANPEGPLIGLVYPDRRGAGYGLGRHQDDPGLNFIRIGGEPDVHFAHARGFVAKSSATDENRLRELLAMAAV